MSNNIISSAELAAALQDEGLLPKQCKLIEVLIEPTGVPTLRYTVFVEKEDLAKLARALMRAGDPAVLLSKVSVDGRQQ